MKKLFSVVLITLAVGMMALASGSRNVKADDIMPTDAITESVTDIPMEEEPVTTEITEYPTEIVTDTPIETEIPTEDIIITVEPEETIEAIETIVRDNPDNDNVHRLSPSDPEQCDAFSSSAELFASYVDEAETEANNSVTDDEYWNYVEQIISFKIMRYTYEQYYNYYCK